MPIARISHPTSLIRCDGEAEPIPSLPAQLRVLLGGIIVLDKLAPALCSRFSVRLGCLSLGLSRDDRKAVVLFAHNWVWFADGRL